MVNANDKKHDFATRLGGKHGFREMASLLGGVSPEEHFCRINRFGENVCLPPPVRRNILRSRRTSDVVIVLTGNECAMGLDYGESVAAAISRFEKQKRVPPREVCIGVDSVCNIYAVATLRFP